MVNQVNAANNLFRSGKNTKFIAADISNSTYDGWEHSYLRLPQRGFVVDDSIIIEASLELYLDRTTTMLT